MIGNMNPGKVGMVVLMHRWKFHFCDEIYKPTANKGDFYVQFTLSALGPNDVLLVLWAFNQITDQSCGFISVLLGDVVAPV